MMTEVTSTAARIVKKSLWKDIQRWVDKDYKSGPLEIDTHNKRKFLRRALELTKKNDGDFYAGAVLTEPSRFPSKGEFIVLTWDTYIDSKRLAIIPFSFDKSLEPVQLRGIALTEHAIEQIAIRLGTLNRVEVIREITAAAMPSCFMAINFWGFTPRDGDCFAVKTPNGIGILIINHLKDVEVAGYLVTWISDEEATARKFREIEWALLPRRTNTKSGSLTVDIPAGAKMYFPHELSEEWKRQVLRDYL